MTNLAFSESTTKQPILTPPTTMDQQTEPLADFLSLYCFADEKSKEYYAKYCQADDDRHRLSLLLMSVFMNLRAAFDRGDLEENWKMIDRINESLASFPLPDSTNEVVRRYVTPLVHEVHELKLSDDLPF